MDFEKQIEQLKRENKMLKNRCRVLSNGTLCCFCLLECKNRKTPFRGNKGAKDV